ncbi:uncharacterized protein LOC129597505 [Paramacrobiotus metropolitanus]|uniref:uncharacterized protein LOC129597505 n=1 Tax=Paramacrobiotus metropolitanus TaxID=2943436 RepID=UPI00244601E7|nr:uncharacterized protein LOC129597505 [Paramacrobiotus metropolitanus]
MKMAQPFLALMTLLMRRYLFVISLVFLLVVIVILTYLMLFSGNVKSENDCECATTQQRSAGNQQTAKRAANVSQNQLSETLAVGTPPALPWSKYEISRTASFSFPYKDFRVLVYERGPVAVGTTEPSVYYFSPALILNTSSANTSFNWFEQRFVVTFSLIMYNKEYTDHIKTKILQIINVQVKDQNLHVMPIEEMRLISSNPEWDSEIEVDTTWRSYSSQSDSSEFRIFCTNGFKCQRLKEGIEKKGSEFIGDIEVHYALESQRSAARRLTLTAEHIQTGKMFTELEQRYAGYDEVYLNGEDSKRMQQEIASNVMAAEIADSEYVSGEQSPTLLKFIEQALSLQEVSSAKFTPEMWKSVYWKDENSRPDKITREYQNSFDKQDRETQSRIMDYFKKAEKESWCAKTGGGVSEVASGNLKVCSDTSSSSAQRNEMENYLRNINEGRKATEMQGEKFVPKEMS